MILSASRRTDIPCWYMDWFMNRVRAGYALARNPMNAGQVSRVPLSPEVVDGVVFWTKDAKNLLPHLDELDALGYHYYVQFTLTPYEGPLEPGLRPKRDIMDTFEALSRRVGRDGVVWRYDPIVLNDELDMAWHKARFAEMARRLHPFTDQVTISFVDLYARVKSPLIRPIAGEEARALAAFIGDTAAAYGLRAAACCEAGDFSALGVGRAACVDAARLAARCGCSLRLAPDKNQRLGCGCAASVDIGAYGTCANGCAYCYAGGSGAAAKRNAAHQDAQAELLGLPLKGHETITPRPAKSCKSD